MVLLFIPSANHGVLQLTSSNQPQVPIQRYTAHASSSRRSARVVHSLRMSAKDQEQSKPFGEPDDWMKDFASELGPVVDDSAGREGAKGQPVEKSKWLYVEGELESDAATRQGWAAWNTALIREYTNEEELVERDPNAEVDMWRGAARDLGFTAKSERSKAAGMEAFDPRISRDDDEEDEEELGGVENFPDVEAILGSTNKFMNSEPASLQQSVWDDARDVTRESFEFQEKLREEVESYDPRKSKDMYKDVARDILGNQTQEFQRQTSENDWNPSRDWSRFDDRGRQNQIDAEKQRRLEFEQTYRSQSGFGLGSGFQGQDDDDVLSGTDSEGEIQYVDADGNILSKEEVEAAFREGASFVDETTGDTVDFLSLGSAKTTRPPPIDDIVDIPTSPAVSAADVLQFEPPAGLVEEDEFDANTQPPQQVNSFLSRLASKRSGSQYGSDSSVAAKESSLPPRDPAAEKDFWKNSVKDVVDPTIAESWSASDVTAKSAKPSPSTTDTSSLEDISVNDEESASAWSSWQSATKSWTESVSTASNRNMKADADMWRSTAREVAPSSSSDMQPGDSDWGAGLDGTGVSERSAWGNWQENSPLAEAPGATLWFQNRPDAAKSMNVNPLGVSESSQPDFWRDMAKDIAGGASKSAASSSAESGEATDSNIDMWKSFAKDISKSIEQNSGDNDGKKN
eukprot:CAMPEP_0184698714 /NCGR_PEP_ID=MMETSP0313-20130426/5226_1 /TAXON_ID=2792 /ORGANISM="Porphyridium aerugineum, Strain SAG 1380-2" /LENGTH=685 /DNA_ID=CAMNT_0027157685 /DNA_START=93 /DNA_END=2150 /DNA_ORIENTATION=-